MPIESPSPAAFAFAAKVERAYSGLLASPFANAEAGLAGRLLYAGELDGDAQSLLAAANIAGAASLVATADRAAQKQAVRDGIADFLVNSLDEALRILKNQLRKREPVAVCVGLAPASVESQMRERGVAPDILRADAPIPPYHEAMSLDRRDYDETDLRSIPALVVWQLGSGHHKDLAMLDEIALDCLDANECAARRWIRLAPRYLARLAPGTRVLSAHREFVARFFEQLRARTAKDEITFSFEIRAFIQGLPWSYSFNPEKH